MPELAGHLHPLAGAIGTGHRLSDGTPLRLSFLMRPRSQAALGVVLAKASQPGAAGYGGYLSAEAFEARFAPRRADVDALCRHLQDGGLRILGLRGGQLLRAEGRATDVMRLFQTELREVSLAHRKAYHAIAEPQLPARLRDLVLAIFGLETVSDLVPLHRRSRQPQIAPNGGRGYTPQDITAAYRFPQAFSGRGQTIAILEFSNGYNPQDLQAFWSAFGIRPPEVDFVSVDGATNDGGISPDDVEATLDLEWAGAMAPAARLAVYEASAGDSYAAFAAAMASALMAVASDTQRRPQVASISYGNGEASFPLATMQAWQSLAQRLATQGCTVCVASGDQGAYGMHSPLHRPLPHCDTPASVPEVTAVGGTTLVLDRTRTIIGETGWTDTNDNGASGGGYSAVFAEPAWQQTAAITDPSAMRGVPDVALNADPDSGYAIMFQGQMLPVGGTSAAAPVFAALVARINEARHAAGKGPLGLLGPALYSLAGTAAIHDIVSGNNSYGPVQGYACGPGWDAVTGVGSVDATALLKALG